MFKSLDSMDVKELSSIGKAFAILSIFTENSPSLRTSDIANKLGLTVSTVSRQLSTMLDFGFVERDDITGFYSPGPAIIGLAGLTLQNNDLYRHGAAEIQLFAHEHNVHCHLGMPHKKEIIHLVNSCSKNTMDLLIPMGHTHPMYCSAMGRAILAYTPIDKVQQILKNSSLVKYTPETKTDFLDISHEIVLSNQRGYCLMLDELIMNKGALAAPIFDRNRNPIGAISISAGSSFLKSKETDLSKALLVTASRISGKLGYFPK